MLRHSVSLASALSLFVIFSFPVAFDSTAHAQTPRAPTNTPTASTSAAPNAAAMPPSPRDVLGFTPGDDRTIADWRQITDYFSRLDAASERVKVETLGTTTLGRPFIIAFISADENIRNLQKYKEIQRRLADPRLIRSTAEREDLIRDGRAVVVISCSIHSNEPVASQMSMQLAYDLATAQDERTREILRNTILILIPSANPDGIDIIANWYRKTLGTQYEGTEPPEIYHHYAGHDNNRDWYMLNLPETKLVSRLFWREWFPQIVYDVHQQGREGSRFFVPPFHDPANPLISPLLLREVGSIGSRVAANLQAVGYQGVITNAIYDMWWHGGFRTAPYYHNSIGILSEAASARLMTPVEVTREQLAKSSSRGMPSALEPAINFPEPWQGGLWRPSDIMDMEMLAANTILSLASTNREYYLQITYNLAREANEWQPQPGAATAYLIPAGQGKDEAIAKMLSALIDQGVQVHRMNQELHLMRSGQKPDETIETPGGSYVVLVAQPFGANVRALFEPQAYPNRRAANGETERPYDVTGWTLPMQMGIEVQPIVRIRERDHLTLINDEATLRSDLGLPPAPPTKTASDANASPKQSAAAQTSRLTSTLVSPVRNPLTQKRRIGIYRSWTAPMDEGWTRYVFDTFNIPYTSLHDTEMRGGNLRDKYDVIILPSQRTKEIVEGLSAKDYPAEYTGGLSDTGVENLRRFVMAGGTLICFDAATDLAIKRFNLPLRDILEGVKPTDFYCPGSILKLDVDTTNEIARGLGKDVDAYFINSSAFEVTQPNGNSATPNTNTRVRIVARYAGANMLRSGYLLGEKLIAGKPALVEATLGRGRIILFGFRPQHRAQTWATYPLIFNALSQ